ncbi:hypothetical protein [Nocardiopsis dassonvillei]|uniref:hypothetical protein n=1 Tax=Nocardiopsis dassonvillei TaxID=2014 RepID=UPI003F5667E9
MGKQFMRRSAGTVRRWSEAVLGQLGSPEVFELVIEPVDDVEAVVVDTGLAPGASFVLGFENTSEGAESGVLVGISLHPEGYGSMARIPDSLTDGEAVVVLADRFQEEVLESTHGKPAPPCPGHPHPPRPEVVGEVPSWVCPSTGKAVLPIL